MGVILVTPRDFYKNNNTPNIQNNYNINFGDHSHINAINAESATDNSVYTFNQSTDEAFNQSRALIEQFHSQHKQELLQILSNIKEAYEAKNKNECVNWLGRFLSLSAVADYITIAQPIATFLCGWFFSS